MSNTSILKSLLTSDRARRKALERVRALLSQAGREPDTPHRQQVLRKSVASTCRQLTER